MRMIARQLTLSGLTAVCLVFPLEAIAGNAVTTWNEQALDTVRTERLGAAPASRTYAMVNVAMYDAVNGIDRAHHTSTRDHALVPPHGAPRNASRKAAAAAAGHAVLSALYPDLAETYDLQLEADLTALGGRGRPRVARGVAWGETVGTEVVL